MNIITKQDVRYGIENGTIRFVVDHNMESGTVCQIGDNWFYFGGEKAEDASPGEYIKNTPMDEIVSKIYDALEGFRDSDKDEYDYYDAVIEEIKNPS